MKLINIKDNLIKLGEDKTSINTSNGSISTKGDVYVNDNLVNHAGNKATWLQYVYPVNSIYISYVATNPKDIFGFGTWTLISDRFLVGAGNTYSLGATGGAATVTLTTAQMPAHTHSGPSHTHTINSHTHTGPSHTHAGPSHTHTINSHTHSTPNHSHALPMGRSNLEANGYGLAITKGFENRPIIERSTYPRDSTLSGGASTTGGTSLTTNASGTGATGAAGTGNTGGTSLTTNASGTGATGSTGSGSSHENRPPYIAVYIWRRTA